MTIKRAAIYIRVSREKQAEKISPQAQEADCRAYCEGKGYIVVEVYRDIEKYRSGGRLVEPSATRYDRPQLRRMLADVDSGKVDVIIAWREDRLYRGVNRATLEISERVKAGKVMVELSNDYYDPSTAVVKAWAAGIELEAKSERMNMGMAGRFGKGKIWSTSIPYGYQSKDGFGEENPEESIWVKRIWEWAGANMPVREIRQRLLEGNAPQRKAGKIPWQIPFIYMILRNPVYHTGIQTITWDNETYEISYPILVDQESAKRVAKRKERNKAHPSHNVKHNYLAMGFVYCAACNVKMSSFTSYAYKNGKRTNRLVRDYRCGHFLAGYHNPGCPHRANVKKIDDQLWEKVWSLFQDGEKLEKGIQARVAELRNVEKDSKAEITRIERELENLMLERQWVITQGRKKIITEEDVKYQLEVITLQKLSLKKDLSEATLMVGNKAERLLEAARMLREEVLVGASTINTLPQTPKEEEKQFATRRKIVEAIVTRVDVLEDKTIRVTLEISVPNENGEENQEAPALWR